MPKRETLNLVPVHTLGRLSAEELVRESLYLVTDVVRSFQRRLPANVELDDLVSDGRLGLIEAAQRFDPQRGASFGTFATYRIHGRILDGLRTLDGVPLSVRRQQQAAKRAIATAMIALGRSPTEEEIAVRMGLSLADWQTLRRNVHATGCQLPGDVTPDAAKTLVENLPGASADPEQSAARAELGYRLAAAVGNLRPKSRAVVCLYYVRGWTMAEIGTRIGVSKSRVRQIRTDALGRLRARLSPGFRGAAGTPPIFACGEKGRAMGLGMAERARG